MYFYIKGRNWEPNIHPYIKANILRNSTVKKKEGIYYNPQQLYERDNSWHLSLISHFISQVSVIIIYSLFSPIFLRSSQQNSYQKNISYAEKAHVPSTCHLLWYFYRFFHCMPCIFFDPEKVKPTCDDYMVSLWIMA